MKKLFYAATALTLGAVACAQAAEPPLPWAYGFPAAPAANAQAAPLVPGPANPADNTTQLKVDGSSKTFTRAQISNRHGPADWFPEDHPAMPEVVAKGKESANVFACGLCHYPNGQGRPENANVAGYSYEYLVQTLTDFKNGNRLSADPRKANTNFMTHFAKSMTDEEIRESAKYFAAIPYKQWIRVVEADTVPKTRPQGGMWIPVEGAEAGTEPIGLRIIETPVNANETEVLRNPRSGFIAYTPPGSLKKGEALVTQGTLTGGGKITACTACHGPSLQGLGPVPSLAGRSPSYIARQIVDMQHSKRKGTWTPLMVPVVASMNAEDILVASAYLASLKP